MALGTWHHYFEDIKMFSVVVFCQEVNYVEIKIFHMAQ